MRHLLLLTVLLSPLLVAAQASAQYTLFVARYDDASHVRIAKAVRDQLIAGTELKDWYILHKSGESLLYHGRYESQADANTDRDAIGRLVNKLGDPLFPRVLLVSADEPDPEAPPQWNIVNTNAKWTLVIADYTGDAQRKQAAVESVRAAREMGIEAYYFHGPTTSSVLIGAWPINALRAQEVGNPEDFARTGDRTLVVSSLRLPTSVRRAAEQLDDGRVEILEPKIEITDASMARAMQEYPEYALNGELVVEVMAENGRKVRAVKPSFIADIDQIRGIVGADDQAPVPTAPEQPLLIRPEDRRGNNPLQGLE
ncbi:MAG: hypothetical protein AAGD32_01545 [Planctomycetota bacterium]